MHILDNMFFGTLKLLNMMLLVHHAPIQLDHTSALVKMVGREMVETAKISMNVEWPILIAISMPSVLIKMVFMNANVNLDMSVLVNFVLILTNVKQTKTIVIIMKRVSTILVVSDVNVLKDTKVLGLSYC